MNDKTSPHRSVRYLMQGIEDRLLVHNHRHGATSRELDIRSEVMR